MFWQIYKKREYCFFLHHALAVWKCEISLLLGKKPHRIGDWNLGLGRPWHYTVTIRMQVYKSFTTFLQFQTKTGAMHECLIPGTFCLLFFISTIIFFFGSKGCYSTFLSWHRILASFRSLHHAVSDPTGSEISHFQTVKKQWRNCQQKTFFNFILQYMNK